MANSSVFANIGNLSSTTTASAADRRAWPLYSAGPAEPQPDWSRAKQVWRFWWPLHIYFYGFIFALCGLLSATLVLPSVIIRRGAIGSLKQRQRVSLALVMGLTSLLRSFFLLVDAYHSTLELPIIVVQLANGLTYPSIITMMALVDRLLAGRIDYRSINERERHHQRRRVPVLSKTTTSAVVTYFFTTALLFSIATLITSARISVLIVEATFSTWGFALAFVGIGRSVELRRVAKRADEARRRMIDYVRLKRQLADANVFTGGSGNDRQQRQRLKALRRQAEEAFTASLKNSYSWRQDSNCGVNGCKHFNNRGVGGNETSSSSSSEWTSDNIDRIPDLSLLTVDASSDNAVADDNRSHTQSEFATSLRRPADLPLWSASASVISGGVTSPLSPTGYSSLPQVTTLNTPDRKPECDTTSRETNLKTAVYCESNLMAIDNHDCTENITAGNEPCLHSSMTQNNVALSRRIKLRPLRYERFSFENENADRKPKSKTKTSSGFFARLRFDKTANVYKGSGGKLDSVSTTTFPFRDISIFRRSFRHRRVASDVDDDHNVGRSRASDTYGLTTSGWKSETTLLSHMSNSLTSMPHGDVIEINRKSSAVYSDDDDDFNSDTSDSNENCGEPLDPTKSESNVDFPVRSVCGSPGYAADNELEFSFAYPNGKKKLGNATGSSQTRGSSFPGMSFARLSIELPAHIDEEDGNEFAGDCTNRMIALPGVWRRRTRLSEVVGLRRVVAVSGYCIAAELALCAIQIYTMFGVYGVLSNVRTVESPWGWYTFQTISRSTEVLFLMTSLTMLVVTNPRSWCCRRRHRRSRLDEERSTTSNDVREALRTAPQCNITNSQSTRKYRNVRQKRWQNTAKT